MEIPKIKILTECTSEKERRKEGRGITWERTMTGKKTKNNFSLGWGDKNTRHATVQRQKDRMSIKNGSAEGREGSVGRYLVR